jgi:glycosyltransferase involved in cell wall biosynthesis
VVALTNPGVVADGLRADGIRVVHLGMRGNRDIAALRRLTREIRAARPDLVHCHLYRACVYGRPAARLAGVRTVLATEHSLLGDVLEGRRVNAGARLLYRATERLGRMTVAVSPDTAGHLAAWGIPRDRITVLPNGVDLARHLVPASARAAQRLRLREELGIPGESWTLGGVGRLVPGKRFDLLVRVLAQLPERARLLLVGAGPEREPLQRLAAGLGVADRVVFAGERADVPEMLYAMDALAAPSEGETFGLVLLEGLAAGLPVLWTNGPALAGLPPEEIPQAPRLPATVAAYAAAAAELMTAPAHGRRPPDVLQDYDVARIAPKLASLYRTLLGDVPPPRALDREARPQTTEEIHA